MRLILSTWLSVQVKVKEQMIVSVPNSLKEVVSFDSSQVQFDYFVLHGRRKIDCVCVRESSEILRESDNEVNGGASVQDDLKSWPLAASRYHRKTCLDVEKAEKHRETCPWREICREVFG